MKSWPRPLWPTTDSDVINAININHSIYLPCFGMSSSLFLHFQVNEILNVADLATQTVSGSTTTALLTSTQTAVTAIVNKINEILAKATLTCNWYGNLQLPNFAKQRSMHCKEICRKMYYYSINLCKIQTDSSCYFLWKNNLYELKSQMQYDR